MKTNVEKVSQQVLLEIIARKVETLEQVSRDVLKTAPQVRSEIERLERMRLVAEVNTTSLEAFRRQFQAETKEMTQQLEKKLQQGVLLPQWMVHTFWGLSLWTILATGVAVWHYKANEKLEVDKEKLKVENNNYFQQNRNLQIELDRLKEQQRPTKKR